MKYVTYLVMLLLFSIKGYSQCIDVFGRASDCPTENDSFVVYKNALTVYEFYEKNRDYVKLNSKRLRTKQDVIDCFYQMEDAVDSFRIKFLLRERVINGEDIPSVLLPRDGKNIPTEQYYTYIDAYRFYQRELENGILNMASPSPIYDIRIAPLLINSYENRFGTDGYNGDFVNVALYIPVTVKPYSMLSDSEKVIRKNILQGQIPKIIKKQNKKVSIPKLKAKVKDTTLLQTANIYYEPPPVVKQTGTTYPPMDARPIYYENPYGGGWLMGYFVKRKFRKYLPTDEFYWCVPNWLKDFLNDDVKVEKYMKQKYGTYYGGLYGQ